MVIKKSTRKNSDHEHLKKGKLFVGLYGDFRLGDQFFSLNEMSKGVSSLIQSGILCRKREQKKKCDTLFQDVMQ